MSDDCRKLIAHLVVRRTPDALSDHHASVNKKVHAFRCLLGIGWAKQTFRCAAARKLPRMIRSGLSNKSTKPCAKQRRTDLRAVQFSADEASSFEGSQWRPFIKKRV